MTGFDCFLNGFSLIRQPGLRRYFVVPILINTVVLLLLAGFSYQYFNSWMDIIMGWFPDWMSALYWLIWFVALLVVLVMVLFLFTFIANIIASPFNALLSIKVEERLTGSPPVSNVSLWMVLPRTVAREIMKLFYVVPRVLLLVILTLIPVVNTISPILWILFGAWMMAIQYADYGADNNDVSFAELKDRLRGCRMDAVMFGLPAYLLLTVPVVNLILMPVGVAGGTRFWVDHVK